MQTCHAKRRMETLSVDESFNYLWGIFAVPLGYLYTLALGHRGKIAKLESEVDDLKELKPKVDKLCENVEYIKGKIDAMTENKD